MSDVRTPTLFIIAGALALLGFFLLQAMGPPRQSETAAITSFDECAAAGYPIMESFPEQCRTPDGRTFVNDVQGFPGNPSWTPDEDVGLEANRCAVGGCSGQLCISAGEAGDLFTTCEFRAEYACYREASCELQANGVCGWTQTPALAQCLANPPPL